MLDDELDQYLKTLTPIRATIYGRKKLCYSVSCHHCGKEHLKEKCDFIKGLKAATPFFCSRNCLATAKDMKEEKSCLICGKLFFRTQAELRKVSNNFCSYSCNMRYSNQNKTKGVRRSKLEIYVETEIKSNFPNLICLYNNKATVGYELDIYFPEIKLAIQLDGPYHHKPIHGLEKLTKTQRIDTTVDDICRQRQIKLHRINCSDDNYIAPTLPIRWKECYNIITNHLRTVKDLNLRTALITRSTV